MSRKKPRYIIECEAGEVYVTTPQLYASFRQPYWLLQINPNVLLPGLRKDSKRVIYVNGKRYGIAYHSDGCIPLDPFILYGKGIGYPISNFLRQKLGVACKPHERGYYSVKMKGREYIIQSRRTKEGNLLCVVHFKRTKEFLGSFIYDAGFEKVYPRFARSDWVHAMYVIIGYMTSVLLYSTVTKYLTRTLDIVV